MRLNTLKFLVVSLIAYIPFVEFVFATGNVDHSVERKRGRSLTPIWVTSLEEIKIKNQSSLPSTEPENLNLLAEQGDPIALYKLKEIEEVKKSKDPKNSSITLKDRVFLEIGYQLADSAGKGCVRVQEYLGRRYLRIYEELLAKNTNHHDLERAREAAIRWTGEGCVLGSPDSQKRLGYMYHRNFITAHRDVTREPDPAEQAVFWWRLAADKGDAEAQYFVGLSFHNGRGVQQNTLEAVSWYEKAYRNGNQDPVPILVKLLPILYLISR